MGVLILFFAIAIGLILRSKSQNGARDAVAVALEQELDADRAALESQKEKVVELTQQLDAIKQKFSLGLIKDEDKPQTVKQYNQLAAQQRAERDKFTPMANAYNEKVARLRQLK